jgi:hypothetical protein
MRSYILLSVAILGAAIIAACDAGPDQATLARILGRQGECVRLGAEMTRLGTLTRVVRDGSDNAFAYVDTAYWNQQTTENRLMQSLTVYCALTPPNGYFTVTTRNAEGENVFRIRNGHVVSWL